jgi:hypothetical protein
MLLPRWHARRCIALQLPQQQLTALQYRRPLPLLQQHLHSLLRSEAHHLPLLPPPSTLPPSGLTRTAACAPKSWTALHSVPKVTHWRPWPAEAAVLQRSASCAACATHSRSATAHRSGWRAAPTDAAQATPCATAASARCIARPPLQLAATTSRRWYVPSGTCLFVTRVAFLTLLQGVAVFYLLWLKSTLGEWIGRLTVEQACQMIIKPRTSRSRGSLVRELEQHADTSQCVGEATWFVSHTWGNAFADTLDAVLLFFEGREEAATAKVWFDVLVDGQHAIAGPSKPSSWYMTTFRSCIGRIGRLLLVADKWNNPTALRRAW